MTPLPHSQPAPRQDTSALTFADLLPVVEAHLPAKGRELVDRWRPLARLCTLETFAGFEYGLGGKEAPLFDFSIRFRTPAEAAGLAARGMIPPDLARLLAFWDTSTESLDPITAIWVEYDLDRLGQGPPTPVYCTQFAPHLPTERILGEFFPQLLGTSPSPGQRRLIDRVAAEMPPGARLLYITSLRARGLDAIRFEFMDLPPAEVVPYLERLQPGDWQAQVAAPAALHEGNDHFHLSFDVTERIEPRLGFESSLLKQPAREPGWAEFFARLEAAGLSTPAETALALSWSGVETARTAPANWPAVGGAPLRGSCFRALSHVKTVSRPDRPLEAKVYFLLGYAPPKAF